MKSLYLPGLMASCLAVSSAWAAPGAPDAESVPVDAQVDPQNPFALFRPNVFDLDNIKVLTFTGTAVQLLTPRERPRIPAP